MLPGTNVSRVIARQGFDWICVDCEHGNIAGQWSDLFLALAGHPLPSYLEANFPVQCRPRDARVRRSNRLLRRLANRTDTCQRRLDG